MPIPAPRAICEIAGDFGRIVGQPEVNLPRRGSERRIVAFQKQADIVLRYRKVPFSGMRTRTLAIRIQTEVEGIIRSIADVDLNVDAVCATHAYSPLRRFFLDASNHRHRRDRFVYLG